MSALEDPAAAVAAALCVTARSIGSATVRHPRTCGWCDYPLDALSRMVAEFNAWAGDERTAPFGVRAFSGLPSGEQARLVGSAQGLDAPQPEPMAPADAPPPDEEDVPSWIRQP